MIGKSTTTAVVLAALMTAGPAWADRTEARTAIAEAEVLIESAARFDASRYAPTIIETARDHLAAAQAHAEEREWRDAEGMALRAQKDAEVAAAKSRAAKSEQVLAELRDTVQTLRNEVNQRGGRS